MYKVFEDCGTGPMFLYHGVGGSRVVPLDVWIDAEVRWVSEGSNPYYWSGFHCYPSLETVAQWRHRVRRTTGRVAVEVCVECVTKKPTKGEAYLALRMQLTAAQWAARIPLKSVGS